MGHKKAIWVTVLLVTCLVPSLIYAVSTAYWEVNTKSAFAQGELENLVMNPEGEVLLGKALNRIPVDESSLWCSVRDKKGIAYFGSGTGKVYKLAGTNLQEVFNTNELLVTSLAVSDKNELFAATIPNGKIFKIDQAGKGTTFCILANLYIWSLAYSAKQDTLYAATGPAGKIYKIDRAGKATEFYDTRKPNILCLLLDKDQNLYFGTSSPGILYRLTADGKPSVLHDFGDSEIKALALHKEELYLAVNSGVKALPQDFLGAVRAAAEKAQSESECEEKPPQPQQPPAPKQPKPLVQSSVYSLSPDNRLKLIHNFDNSYLTDLKITAQGEILVGTDNTGKVFRLMADGSYSIPYDVETEQVLTLLMDKKGELEMISSGKPGNVFITGKEAPLTASYISEVFNAGFPAQWGSFNWVTKGALNFQTRSGNTEEPDETWSDWSDLSAVPDLSACVHAQADTAQAEAVSTPGKVKSPAAKHLQFRVNWDKDKGAVLSKVSIAYLIQNQPPKILDLKIENQPLAGGGEPQHGKAPLPPRLIAKKISWQVQDTDNDPLGIRIYYREETETHWILLNPDSLIAGNEFLWNTESVPDGKYLIKIEVTDETANPAEKHLTDERISAPQLVDNTKPVIKELQLDEKRFICQWTVEDNFSYISRVEYLLDNGEWCLIHPADNLFDQSTERFSLSLGKPVAGTHVVHFRAFDSLGNMAVARKIFTVKK
jgi:hypothetical protein